MKKIITNYKKFSFSSYICPYFNTSKYLIMKNCLTILFSFILYTCFGQDFKVSSIHDPEIGSFAVGDFNGDGYTDIIGIEYEINSMASIHLYTNKKENNIGFTASEIFNKIPFSGRPTAADLDGDGDIDFIYNNSLDNTLNILVNNGSGVFTQTALGVAGSTRIMVVDIDNDGDLDMVGLSRNSKMVIVYKNNGGLSFSTSTIYNTNKTPEALDIADFDGDGDMDVLVGFQDPFNDQVFIFQNDGNGNFTEIAIPINGFNILLNIYAADINKDGRIDILVTTDRDVKILENKGSLSFEEKVLATTNVSYFTGASVVDLTGEGNPDIILGTNKEFQWYKNLSLTDYSYEQRVLNGVTGAFHIISVDLNNDGARDVITCNGSLWWYQNLIPQLPSSVDNNIIIEYKVFPNPVSSEIWVKGLIGDGYNTTIYNQMGQEMLKAPLTGDKVEVHSLPSGKYIMILMDAQGKIIGKESIVKP